MGSFVGVLDVAEDGALTPQQAVSSLPANFNGTTKAAEIVITGDGKFLLASNRGFGQGSNSVAVFAVDAATGDIELVQITSAGGEFPRGMEIIPDSHYSVMVEGQSSGNLAVLTL